MDNDPSELNVEVADLKELARINPLAWEQILHIVDNRINAARIDDLQQHLEQAHKYGPARDASTVTSPDYQLSPNGLSRVT